MLEKKVKLPNADKLIDLINKTEKFALKKGDSLVADIGGYGFSPELWIHSNDYETELRLVGLGDFQIKVSRVQFQKKHCGTMTRVFFFLLDFCRRKNITKIVIESVLSKEMEDWCRKHGFKHDPNTGFMVDGVMIGNYEYYAFDPAYGKYDYDSGQIPEADFQKINDSIQPFYQEKLGSSRYDVDLPFASNSGIHERAHCERVLLFSLWLSSFYNLSKEEMHALSEAALYHDIGRTHDWYDTFHGCASAEIYAEHTHITDDLALFLMQFHCQDDYKGMIKALSGKNPDRRILLLNILKDADALDRFRLGLKDLNSHLFRLPESRSLTSYARKAYLKSVSRVEY